DGDGGGERDGRAGQDGAPPGRAPSGAAPPGRMPSGAAAPGRAASRSHQLPPPFRLARRDRRAGYRPATSRQPSRKRPRKTAETAMNAASVPGPDTARSSWPSATVASHTPTPVGPRAAGRRQARVAASPTARPARNGHAVLATPARLSPSWWLARPITTKASTQSTSASTPRAARTGSG